MDMESIHGKTVNLYKLHNNLGDRYEGEWYKSYKHGFGKDTFYNGDKYIGEYQYGKFSGKGKFVWNEGMIYEGEFRDGMRHGEGHWRESQHTTECDSYEGGYYEDK